MSDQPLDLRRSMRLLWRRKFVVALFAALGLAAGIGLTLLRPEMLTSSALVVLPQSVHNVATQVVIASSDPVLTGAQHKLGWGGPPQTLRNAIKVKSVTLRTRPAHRPSGPRTLSPTAMSLTLIPPAGQALQYRRGSCSLR